MAGGKDGQTGESANGHIDTLPHIASTPMQVDDVFEIHTPGGGFGGTQQKQSEDEDHLRFIQSNATIDPYDD